jgi:hypothetical protein
LKINHLANLASRTHSTLHSFPCPPRSPGPCPCTSRHCRRSTTRRRRRSRRLSRGRRGHRRSRPSRAARLAGCQSGRQRPGADPTKHDFSNFTHEFITNMCNFLQIL